MKHTLTVFALWLFTSFSDKPEPVPQTRPATYPQDYFQSPVAGAIVLSGSFGELRPNHFHAGIDIRPTKKGGYEPIYAAAEGYVSRISVKGGGYGQAVYVNHPNGYTTVYAHLEHFSPEIKAYVRQKQFASERFEQDLTLQPSELPVARGQQIGNMGNRGHSFGQHLHFEIRETASERALNPLLFGFVKNDALSPTMSMVKVYLFDEKDEIVDTKFFPIVKKGDTCRLPMDTLRFSAAKIAFAVKAADKNSPESGNNGIFTLDLRQNDASIYQFKAEGFGFDETRYINAHLDYFEQNYRRSYYHRAFLLPGNQLSMYANVVERGIVPLSTSAQKINLTIGDVAGNTTTLHFFVVQKDANYPQRAVENHNYLLPFAQENVIQPEGAVFYFPKNAFYENVKMRFRVSNTEGGIFSPTYHLHEPQEPVHRYYDIAIKPQNLPEALKSKAFIAYCMREDSRTYNCGGKWETDGYLRAKNNRFGNYCIAIDTVKPYIKPVNFQYDMRKSGRIAFKIGDNFEVMGLTDGITYRATVDGKWLLMEFDSKSDLLYYRFDEGQITEGEHIFNLVVTDNRGNANTFEGKFKR